MEEHTGNAGDLFYWLLSGDLAGSLAEAVSRFELRRGARPQLVKACPALAGDGLKPAAEALGLRVIADRYCLAGRILAPWATASRQQPKTSTTLIRPGAT